MIKELLHLLYLSDDDRTKIQSRLDKKSHALKLIKGELDELLEIAQIANSKTQLDEANNKIN